MSSPTSARQRNRVLFVDDDGVGRIFAKIVLERAGYHVDVALNGSEAIESLLKADYELILMDCKMPVMDGLEATKRIRANATLGSNQGIPIIAITADVLQSNYEECIAAGMDDWVAKPIRMAALKDIVQKWLPLAQSGRGR